MNTWPHFSEDEIKAVSTVLRSGKVNYWTGDQCQLFEKEFAAFIGVNHAISLANGTVALELALRACGIGPGDKVITTPRTFIATASSIVAVGAIPVFADIDPISQNITAETISPKITPKTKAIIPVHLAGYPCEMDNIMTLAKQHNLYVIEDCAQAHGATYQGKKVGSFGHFGAFSFCQDKIITTGGEGGMLTCQDTNLYQKAWSYKDHGKDYNASFRQEMSSGFRWLHHSFGSNIRMTEIQAAIGRKQLEKLPSWLNRRNQIASAYNKAFEPLAIIETPQYNHHNIYHGFYKYYLFINELQLSDGWTRDKIIAAINQQGVPCFSGICPEIYCEKAFINSPYKVNSPLPVAHDLGRRSIMLLCHPTLVDNDVDLICNTVTNILKDAQK